MNWVNKLLQDSPNLVSRVGATAVVANIVIGMILSSCSSEVVSISSVSHTEEPAPVTDTLEPTEIPTFTSTPTEIPTRTLTPTPTITPTTTPTPEPTPTMHPARATAWGPNHPILPYNERSFEEEQEKFGYQFSGYNYSYERGKLPMRGLGVIMRDFNSEGVKVRTDGDFIVGTLEYFGEEYYIEAKLDYNNNSARLFPGVGHFFRNTEEAQERIRGGRSHEEIILWVMDVEGHIEEAGRPFSYANGRTTYTIDEWFEIRSVIDELIRGEGSTSNYYFILARLYK